jgi:hypothetical protein
MQPRRNRLRHFRYRTIVRHLHVRPFRRHFPRRYDAPKHQNRNR